MSGGAEDSGEVFMHEGKMYRRVQIEGADEEYLMDEEQNIYDLNLKQVGKAGDDDWWPQKLNNVDTLIYLQFKLNSLLIE